MTMTPPISLEPGRTAVARIDAPTPPAAVEAPSAEPNPFAERIRSGLLTTDQVKALKPPEALVAGYLNRDSLAMLYGPSGACKSFLAADVSLHISRGAWWQKHYVEGGPVVYVVAEGASGFGLRIDAWERQNRLGPELHPVHWYPQAVNISDATWAEALAEVCSEIKPMLIVIDTFARCTVGAEENSAREVGVIVDNLDRIRRATGACVLLVHHTGKDTDRGGRGSSALRGAMDTELELTGDPDRLTLKVKKQKDGPELPPLTLGLVSVQGSNSCTIGAATAVDSDHLPAGVAETLAALVEIDLPTGNPSSAWATAAGKSDRTFFRHRAGLVEQRLVINVGTDKAPKYRPAEAVEGVVP